MILEPTPAEKTNDKKTKKDNARVVLGSYGKHSLASANSFPFGFLTNPEGGAFRFGRLAQLVRAWC